MHDTMYITLIALIAGIGTITNIGSPHDRLGTHEPESKMQLTSNCTWTTCSLYIW